MKISLISLLLATASLYAQSTRGSIGGQVTDAAKKPLSGAAVSLVAEETNRKHTAVTGPQGEFLVTLLDPGTYRLEVDASGFRRHIQDLVLDLNQEIRVAQGRQDRAAADPAHRPLRRAQLPEAPGRKAADKRGEVPNVPDRPEIGYRAQKRADRP